MLSPKLQIKKIEILIGLLIFVTFAITISWALNSFYRETESMTEHFITTTDKDDYIEILANIKSIDPISGDLKLRLTFEPRGKLINKDFLLTNDMYLYVSNAKGEQEFTYPKGRLMYPLDVTLNLYEGLATDYPFDSYKAVLYLEIDTIDNAARLNKDEFTEYFCIETTVNFTGSVSGYNIHASKSHNTKVLYTEIDILISRSTSIKFFSIFVMTAMWSVTILTILLVLSVLTRKRKVEIGMFGFASALLFALPALRNMQPLAPPIGTLSDYLAFFWAESIAAIALIVLIITWLVRKPG